MSIGGRMVPQVTKQARRMPARLCFPLNERYDFRSLTLDGRELSLRLQDLPLEDRERAGGDVPVTAKTQCLANREASFPTWSGRQRRRRPSLPTSPPVS